MAATLSQDIYGHARSAVRRFDLSAADKDDALQEAALAVWAAQRHLDGSRSDGERAVYQRRAAASAVIDFLRWRSRRAGRERSLTGKWSRKSSDTSKPGDGNGMLDIPDPEQIQWGSDHATPESELAAAQLGETIVAVASNIARLLTDQERALLRHRLFGETMRDDLVRLGRGGRGSVSNRVRRKMLAALERAGVTEVTPEYLRRAFAQDGSARRVEAVNNNRRRQAAMEE